MKYSVYFDRTGQVQAVSSSPEEPASGTWEAQGFTRLEVTETEFSRIDRDTKITVANSSLDTITPSVNPVAREKNKTDLRQDAIAAAGVPIAAGSATVAQIREYLTLKDNL